MGLFSWIGGLFGSTPEVKPVYATWPSKTITYSLSDGFGNTLEGLEVSEIEMLVHKAADHWSFRTDIQLVYQHGDSEANIVIKEQDLSGQLAGYGFYPAIGGMAKGLIFDNSQRTWDKWLFYKVALHEFGHCLGLRHSTSKRRIMYKNITKLSIVSQWDAKELNNMYKDVGL